MRKPYAPRLRGLRRTRGEAMQQPAR